VDQGMLNHKSEREGGTHRNRKKGTYRSGGLSEKTDKAKPLKNRRRKKKKEGDRLAEPVANPYRSKKKRVLGKSTKEKTWG